MDKLRRKILGIFFICLFFVLFMSLLLWAYYQANDSYWYGNLLCYNPDIFHQKTICCDYYNRCSTIDGSPVSITEGISEAIIFFGVFGLALIFIVFGAILINKEEIKNGKRRNK